MRSASDRTGSASAENATPAADRAQTAGTRGPLCLFVDEGNASAVEAGAVLCARYGFVAEGEADVGIVVGGDGFMLRTLHRLLGEGRRLALYGVNRGTVGFLLNHYEVERLPQRVAAADATVLRPLRVRAVADDGGETEHLAVNEVSLVRASAQSAHLRLSVDGQIQVEDLYGDGLIVATAAGSTAYNRSAGGPVIPLSAELMALTPVAGFRPRGWRGALLSTDTTVHVEVIGRSRRPVRAAADHRDVGLVREVTVRQASDGDLTLLFDPDHTLEERILKEQFR